MKDAIVQQQQNRSDLTDYDAAKQETVTLHPATAGSDSLTDGNEKDYHMQKVTNPHPIIVRVPGSKSISNRALLIAALAEGTSTLHGLLFSDDSRYFLEALEMLGFPVEVDEESETVKITGYGGKIPRKKASVYVGSAGTAARFLTAFLGLSDGEYCLESSEQMKKRPMKELLESLQTLGTQMKWHGEQWHFPYTVGNPSGIVLSDVTVDVDKSSQFLSALLISSVLSGNDFHIHVKGSHGMAYVYMTIQMMEQFGVTVQRISDTEYLIPADAAYTAREYDIEPDLSAACYFYAMSPLLGVPAQVFGVHSDSMQGDLRFLDLLCEMECRKEETAEGIRILPPVKGKLRGGSFDLSSFSDQALTLAAIAPFASAPVTITGIGHIRYQECDRIEAIGTNLKNLGVSYEIHEENGFSITIYPPENRKKPKLPGSGLPLENRSIWDHLNSGDPFLMHTYQDHRVAMAFSLPGIVLGNLVIEDYKCCRKTFAEYFKVLEESVYNTPPEEHKE